MLRLIKDNAFAFILFGIFTAGVLARPPLPVDETRYLTVAWEMWFSHDWVHLTYNYEPYHHKPPLLFWLINIFWSIFGISRWAGTLPALLSSMAVIFLTGKLAEKLFPEDKNLPARSRLVLLGSLPFLIYGSLIMFDVMMTAWVLGAILFLLKLSEKRNLVSILGFGLCMGMGALTKGPVVGVYTLLPAILAPLWFSSQARQKGYVSYYFEILLAVLIAALPILFWLVQTIEGKDGNFIYWLLWEQTAGRVTGNFSNAHGRPIYFYLPLLPVFLLPWILLPAFWAGLKKHLSSARENAGIRFLFFWIVPGFVVFSLISGKQPHYLVPFFPGLIIALTFMLKDVREQTIKKITLGMFAFFIVGHAIAYKKFLPLYDWRPIAAIVAQYPDKDWAYVRNYNGEFGFLARVEKNLTSTNLKGLQSWFKKHPDGMAVIRYKKPEEVAQYEQLFSMPYRSADHYAGVFRLKKRR